MGCTITIQYKPSVQLTEESLTIVIEDTTYGALTIFENDLKNDQKQRVAICFGI